jgi:hypothetical protein
MVPVILSPTIQQPPGILLQPVVGFVVEGTMVGGASPTRDKMKTKCQRGKDKVERLKRRCKYCLQHGKSFENASICSGKYARSICTGGEGGISLECMICNSITNAGVYCPSLQHKAIVVGEVNTLNY